VGADYNALMWDEMADIEDLLATLDDAAWDHPSLCTGWRVRDVISHMVTGHTYPLRAFLAPGIRAGGNIDKAASAGAIDYANAHTPAEILEAWQSVCANRTKRGVAKLIPPREGFVDHMVHHQDIRRPLGKPRTIPAERLVSALEAAMSVGGMVRAKKRSKGLAFEATDVEWRHGEGAAVRGPGEAILMAVCGRRASFNELEGPGVEILAARAG
jgi:uncharacterized protein (TIGR03083 family)